MSVIGRISGIGGIIGGIGGLMKRSYGLKRIYLYLPVRSWDWVRMLLRMGRTVEVLNPHRSPWRNLR